MHACVCIPLPFECLLIQQVITINDVSRTNTMTATTGEIIPTNSTIDNCAVVPTYMEHACKLLRIYYTVAITCFLFKLCIYHYQPVMCLI